MKENFYKTKQWKKKREAILRRDRYQCQDAKRYGKYREATTVHHIYPLDKYPELALENWNLISLSAEHHNKMHDRMTGETTDAGLCWQRRRQGEFEEWKRKHPPTQSNTD